MIEDYTQELERVSLTEEKTANQYKEARILSTEARLKLNLALAKNIDKIRENKKGIGFEMALIELLKEDNAEIHEAFLTSENKEAEYKGLEKILDALAGRRIAIQGIMKYNLQGERQ